MKNMFDYLSELFKSFILFDFFNLFMKNELNVKVESLYLVIKKY